MNKLRLGPRNGFRGKNGKYYLERCPDCERENYAMSVASGVCAWCGLDANKIKETDFVRAKADIGGRTKLHFEETKNLNKTYCVTTPSFYSSLIRTTTRWEKVTCRNCLRVRERRENGLFSRKQV